MLIDKNNRELMEWRTKYSDCRWWISCWKTIADWRKL